MLKKLFRLGKQRSEAQDSRFPEALRNSILHSLGLKSVPIMPGAAQEAFRIATNPNAEAHDFIGLLEGDEGLSSRVLKIANSVFYDRGGGSKTIVDAVNVIGISELRNLMNATALAGLFPVRHHLRVEFWGHNVATGIAAKVVARALMPSVVDQVFLAGLMHDVGKLLILQQHVDNYERVVKRGLTEGAESVAAEAKVYPFDHAQVGQLIAEKWNFSPDLYEAIGDHHKPWADIQGGSLASIVKLSNLIAHTLGLGITRDAAAYQRIYGPMLDEAWGYFSLSVRDQKRLLQEVGLDFNAEFQNYEGWGRS
ncbi:MAG: HDOD domain-containing protein [Pseudomonadota bacterium]|jgi:HD-like signal output (HDOD) protein